MSQAEQTAVSPRLLALALPLLIAVPYVKALDVGFVWDDRAVVLGDPAVTVGRPLVDTFTRSFWPESDIPRAFFRPITTLSYRLDWLLHGENPTGFHLTNVVLHIAAALLLFVAARRLGARPLGAFAAAGGGGGRPRGGARGCSSTDRRWTPPHRRARGGAVVRRARRLALARALASARRRRHARVRRGLGQRGDAGGRDRRRLE
ncbi:MAG: hypothetical protein U0235_35060 [Polyangiaceae bacterium]